MCADRILKFPDLKPAHGQVHPVVLPGFSDVFPAAPEDAGAVGYLMANLPRGGRTILWVRDRMSGREAGRMYLARNMLHCTPSRPSDVLQAMEDGLGCAGIGAVIGEMWGEPRELSFTATKRLALRSEARRVPCVLIRHNAHANLSAARNRFRITSLPSAAHLHDPCAPGDPRWQVDLFRSRTLRPGTWIVRHDRAEDRLHFTPFPGDGTVGAHRAEGGHAAL